MIPNAIAIALQSVCSTLDAAKIATRPRQRNIPNLLGAPRQPRVPIKRGMAGQINKTFKLGNEPSTVTLSCVQSKNSGEGTCL